MHPIFGLPTQTIYTSFRTRIFTSDAATLALVASGITPVMLPPIKDVQDRRVLLSRIDGLCLVQERSVTPMLYDQDPLVDTMAYDLKDDKETLEWIDLALKMQKKVFAFGNGMHLLNVYYGGNLQQDLTRHHASVLHSRTDGAFVDHFIETLEGTRLEALLGPKAIVNSDHREGLDKLGPGLIPSARSRDGLIEAFESEDGLAFGFQARPDHMKGALKILFDFMAKEVVQ